MARNPIFAVVDLGSNSFRLELSSVSRGKLRRLSYYKETVRLGAGLDAEKNLTLAALRTGWACLRDFAAVLQEQRPEYLRAVATQTLREAKNASVFVQKAEEVLGCKLEVISGREEARLIYKGASARLPSSDETRLVIDIGGRSTEIILGLGMQAQVAESFPVGSVAASLSYFAKGELTDAAFSAAVQGIGAQLGNLRVLYPRSSWQLAYGSAGTTSAVAGVLAEAGFAADCVSMEGLLWLKSQIVQAGRADKLHLSGLKEDRKAVIGGGLAVLLALFELLQIDELQIVSGALRLGVLQDLLAAAQLQEQAQAKIEAQEQPV